MLAFPISILGSNFQNEWAKLNRFQKEKKRRERMTSKIPAKGSASPKPLRALFQKANSTHADLLELQIGLTRQMHEIRHKMNELSEFMELIRAHPTLQTRKSLVEQANINLSKEAVINNVASSTDTPLPQPAETAS